ncbi:hypothetical protein [Vibrio sp. 10N]|uniref:hypothetical protein n=1 Tax=Vibrio sp. 10N TaxID=3058938 RepID=UPI0028132062|nr:hypothetical protein VB10N_11220 [Vibrio sp. 10N]
MNAQPCLEHGLRHSLPAPKRIAWVPAALVLLLSANLASASDSSWDALDIETDYQVNLQSIGGGESAFLPEQSDRSHEQVNALLDINAQFHSVSANVALLGTSIYDNTPDGHDQRQFDTVISTLTYEASVTFGDSEWDVLMGKARIDWGVGYGYRVLDIFTPYRRNPVGIQIEEGAGTLALSHYGLESEWTLITTDSSWSQLDTSEYGRATEQQGLGGKYYRLLGDLELQMIGYYDNVRQGLLGGSLVNVFNQAWSAHASISYSRRYQGYDITPNQPASLTEKSNASQVLVGSTWSHESGLSVIGEYWYDSRAWSQSEWDSANQYASSNDPRFNPTSQSFALGYSQQNIVQHNVMLHGRLDPIFWRQWQWSKDSHLLRSMHPRLDIMIAPEDGGIIATQWLDFDVVDTGDTSFNLELAARFVTGATNSVYANLPDTYNILINLKGRF